ASPNATLKRRKYAASAPRMAKHTTGRSQKQSQTNSRAHISDGAQKVLRGRTAFVKSILPCEAFPLMQERCGCASLDLILRGIAGDVRCPFSGPEDCPLQKTPSS